MENKYLNEMIKIIQDLQGWVLALVVVVAGAVIAVHGIRYIQGGAHEKQQAIQDMKSTGYMGVGIFFLVWFITTMVGRMKGL